MDSRSDPNHILSPPTASALPYDILVEIFLCCLPRSPLDEIQPNTKIAPMLLCHVCSSWRAAALASPALWSHLYIRLPIRWRHVQYPVTWDLRTFQIMVEFSKWWRGNQRSQAPFIRCEIYREEKGESSSWKEHRLTGDLKFFAEYLSSAQYLDIHTFSRGLLEREDHSQLLIVCPNLHSLVAKYYSGEGDEEVGSEHFLPFHIAPTVQRLSIRGGTLPTYKPITLPNWSQLTHLSLHRIIMLCDVWYTLIRGFPDLQWAYVAISLLMKDGVQPPRGTLSCLSTLTVNIDALESGMFYPPILLFENMHLPALHTLSVCSDMSTSMYLPLCAIAEVRSILKSAPAVTKIAIIPQLLAYRAHKAHHPRWHAEPFSKIAPSLMHFQLNLPVAYAERLPRLREAFFGTPWLDLKGPTNTIQKILIVVKTITLSGDPLVKSATQDKLTSIMEEFIGNADGVEFEITWEEEGENLPGSEGWNTWSSI